MYNIRSTNRPDMLLGCSVPTYAEAEVWLKQYQQRYPTQATSFSIIETNYAGDMANESEALARHFGVSSSARRW